MTNELSPRIELGLHHDALADFVEFSKKQFVRAFGKEIVARHKNRIGGSEK